MVCLQLVTLIQNGQKNQLESRFLHMLIRCQDLLLFKALQTKHLQKIN